MPENLQAGSMPGPSHAAQPEVRVDVDLSPPAGLPPRPVPQQSRGSAFLPASSPHSPEREGACAPRRTPKAKHTEAARAERPTRCTFPAAPCHPSATLVLRAETPSRWKPRPAVQRCQLAGAPAPPSGRAREEAQLLPCRGNRAAAHPAPAPACPAHLRGRLALAL